MPAPVQIIFGAQTEAAASKINGLLDGLGQKLAGLASLTALVKLATWFEHMTAQAIEAADAMGKMAQKTGIAVESMSRLAYAAEIGDLQVGELQVALKELSGEMVKNGEASKSVEQKLLEIAEEFEHLDDGAQKSTRAVELFGRSGVAMIPFLNEGRAGIQRLMKEADDLGLVVGPQFAQRADEFNDNLTRIKKFGEGAFLRLADQILPDLLDLSQRFLNFLKEIDGKVRVVDSLAFAFRGIANAIREIGDGGNFLPSLVKGQIQAGQQDVGNTLVGSMVKFMMGAGTQGLAALAPPKTSTGNFITKEDSAKISGGKLDLAEAESVAAYQRRELTLAQYLGKRRALIEGAYGVELQLADGNSAKEEMAQTAKQTRMLALEEDGRKEAERLRQESNAHQVAQLDSTIQDTERALSVETNGARRIELLRLEGGLLAEKAGLLAHIAAQQSDTTAHDAALAAYQSNADKQAANQAQINQVPNDTYFTRMSENLSRLQEEWGQVGANIADLTTKSIGTAVDGVANSIAGMIDGTADWGRTFANVAKSIIANIIGIAIQWVLSMTLIAVLKRAFKTAETTEAATAAVAWAPAAIAASIASFGSAATAGGIAFAAAMLAGTALAGGLAAGAGAFAEGGYVSGPGTGKSDSILARISNGEYVIPANVVQDVGVGFFDSLRAGGNAAQSTPAAAPQQRGGGGPNFKVGVIRTRQELRDFMREEGTAMVFDEFGIQRTRFGLDT